MKEKLQKLFLVRNGPDEDYPNGCWEIFDSLEDCVSEAGTDVYEAEPKLLGRFQRRTVYEKVKKRGRPRK